MKVACKNVPCTKSRNTSCERVGPVDRTPERRGIFMFRRRLVRLSPLSSFAARPLLNAIRGQAELNGMRIRWLPQRRNQAAIKSAARRSSESQCPSTI